MIGSLKSKLWAILLGLAALLLPLSCEAYATTSGQALDALNRAALAQPSFLAPPITDQNASSGSRPSSIAYKVEQGDSVFGIARKFDISVDQLVAANHIANPDLIHPSDTLTIPQPDTPSTDAPQVLDCTLTAYTSGPESTGKVPGETGYGITSTGAEAIQGVTIAVDPTVIPYGSRVYIEGLGYRLAQDTGGAILGDHIDVYFNDLATALQFGVQRDVKVIVWPKSSS